MHWGMHARDTRECTVQTGLILMACMTQPAGLSLRGDMTGAMLEYPMSFQEFCTDFVHTCWNGIQCMCFYIFGPSSVVWGWLNCGVGVATVFSGVACL